MRLAYLFWHQAGGADGYEESLRTFHESLPVPSASFRLAQLPFLAEPGYEDWYLVDSWQALGELGRVALDTGTHDPVAAMSRHGWGGVWAPVSGPADIPEGAISWADKPRGVPYRDFFQSLDGDAIWCRQLVLGPAPEVAIVSGEPSAARTRIA
jgi:hypothetical protein